MKMNKFFMGILGALALTACSSEEVIPDQPNNGIDPNLSRYIAITIRNADSGTRAEGDQTKDDENGLFEEGLSPENTVETIRFYFFDATGEGRAVKADGTNFMDIKADTIKTDNPGSSMPNVEKILTAVLAISTQSGDNIESLKSVVAVVNGKNLPGNSNNDDEKLVSLSKLREIISDFSIGDNTPYNNKTNMPGAFLMTNSVYGSGAYQCETEIKPGDLKTTASEARTFPVDVYVERVLAKVRMTLDWNSGMTLVEDVTFGGTTNNVAVKLTDKNGEAYKTYDDKDLYVIFTGWGLQTTSDKSYMFKNFKLDWNFNWTLGTKRSYWALNPQGENKIKYRNFSHGAATKGKIGTTYQNGSGQNRVDYDGDFFYCQENAGDDEATGLKAYTDLDETLSNRTQAYLGGTLVTLDGKTATAVDLASYGGKKYEKSLLPIAMLDIINDQIYTRKEIQEPAEDGTTKIKYEYTSIQPEDVELIEEEYSIDVPDEVTSIQNGKRYLARIQLKDGVFAENKFFKNTNGEAYESDEEINRVLKTAGSARVWGGGTTYYFVELNHIGVTDEEGNSFGVVRNHIYDVIVNTVYGLGTPVLTPNDGEGEDETPIKPEKPGDDESFLGVRLNILSWRVVRNTTILDWD